MKKLSIRNRGGYNFEVGPTNGDVGKGRTVMVSAKNKQEALTKARPIWKDKYDSRTTRPRGGASESKATVF